MSAPSPPAQTPERASRTRPGHPADLLHQVMTATVDPDYAAVASRRRETTAAVRTPGWRPAAAVAVVLLGMLIAAAAVERNRTAPQVERDRLALIERMQQTRDSIASTQAATTAVRADIAALEGSVSAIGQRGEALEASLGEQRMLVGSVAVTGPGLRILVDDADAPDRRGLGLVLDTDLQALVNGLWQSGAEAIAINGNRLGPLTAIRVAGEAITVNYRSLSAPYVVEVIGDPAGMQPRFIDTWAGQAWLDLRANYGITFEPSEREELSLPALPTPQLTHAELQGGLP